MDDSNSSTVEKSDGIILIKSGNNNISFKYESENRLILFI
jgi:uncharacterized protein YbcV (DUF1398 family)